MFLPLTKIKRHNIKSIDYENVYKICKPLKYFALKYHVPHKLHVLKYRFQNFPAVSFVFTLPVTFTKKFA